MANIGSLNVKLGMNAAGFTSGLTNAQKHLKGVEGALGSFGKAAIGAFAGFASFATIQSGFRSLVSFTKTSFESADALVDLAGELAISTEALSKLQYAAKMADVSNDDLTGGFRRLTRLVGDAEAGVSEAAETLNRYGLTAGELSGLSVDQVFAKVADAIAVLPSRSQQAAAAFEILGKTGAKAVNLLAGGSKGLLAAGNEGQALGGVMGALDAARISEADTALKKVDTILGGIGRRLAVEVGPFIGQIADDAERWAVANPGVAGGAPAGPTTSQMLAGSPGMQALAGRTGDAIDLVLLENRIGSAIFARVVGAITGDEVFNAAARMAMDDALGSDRIPSPQFTTGRRIQEWMQSVAGRPAPAVGPAGHEFGPFADPDAGMGAGSGMAAMASLAASLAVAGVHLRDQLATVVDGVEGVAQTVTDFSGEWRSKWATALEQFDEALVETDNFLGIGGITLDDKARFLVGQAKSAGLFDSRDVRLPDALNASQTLSEWNKRIIGMEQRDPARDLLKELIEIKKSGGNVEGLLEELIREIRERLEGSI